MKLKDDLFGYFAVSYILNVYELNKYLIDIKFTDAEKITFNRLRLIHRDINCRILPNPKFYIIQLNELYNNVKITDKNNLYIWIYIRDYFSGINNYISGDLLVEVPLHTYLTKLKPH